MPDWEAWEWVLCAGTVFVSVVMLVRMMLSRREEILDEIGWQAEFEQRRKSLDANQELPNQSQDAGRRQAG